MDKAQAVAISRRLRDVQSAAVGRDDESALCIFCQIVDGLAVDAVWIAAVVPEMVYLVGTCRWGQTEQAARLGTHPEPPLAVFEDVIDGIAEADPARLQPAVGSQPKGASVIIINMYVSVLVSRPEPAFLVDIERIDHFLALAAVFPGLYGHRYQGDPFQSPMCIHPDAPLAVEQQDIDLDIPKALHIPDQFAHLLGGAIGIDLDVLSLVRLELPTAPIKEIELVVRPADDIVRLILHDVTDTVRLQRAVVARLRLERLEAVAVVAAQAVPRGQPDIAHAVLYRMLYERSRETVAFAEVLDMHFLPDGPARSHQAIDHQ